MTGVILCGGESKRMGTDKGLIEAGSVTWVQHAEIKMNCLGIPVLISINQSQFESYNRIYNADRLVIDSINVKGPLKGLLSVHQLYPDEDLVLLACDMTDMDVDTLKELKSIQASSPEFDYYLYECEGFMEPLCAIYPASTLKLLFNTVSSSELTHFSMHKLIRESNYKTIPIMNKEKFSNYNTASYYANRKQNYLTT